MERICLNPLSVEERNAKVKELRETGKTTVQGDLTGSESSIIKLLSEVKTVTINEVSDGCYEITAPIGVLTKWRKKSAERL